ncbi:MAG: hypothetical protein LBC97_16380 [Bifidobacteriaceae bacterium]|jgi:hypothetical protein|nr:hypothetical protein [Bifidobacteriaceae bacterium]
MLAKIRPEATAAAFAHVLMQASTVDAAEFADYGLPAAGTARMAERLRAAAASL